MREILTLLVVCLLSLSGLSVSQARLTAAAAAVDYDERTSRFALDASSSESAFHLPQNHDRQLYSLSLRQQVLTTITSAVYENREYMAGMEEDGEVEEEEDDDDAVAADDAIDNDAVAEQSTDDATTTNTTTATDTDDAEVAADDDDDTTTTTTSPKGRCGCASCDRVVWKTVAPEGATAEYTCGNRIQYLMEAQGASKQEACREVGTALELCAPCNPDTCDDDDVGGGADDTTDSTATDDDDDDPPESLPPSITFGEDHYCYPPYKTRQVYDDVWTQNFRVEVKQYDYGVCDPGSNHFSNDTVHVSDDGSELTLEYKQVDGLWRASEVRVLIPDDVFTYGTYRFRIKEVTTYDSETFEVLADYLDKDLVFGMFTWDDTENYTIHENYNHEVDIEISRFGHDQKWDVQFLIQPPEPLHYTRFHSGGKVVDDTTATTESLDQGNNHTYQFTWQPTQMDWYTDTAGGVNYTYTTQQAIDANQPDRIQCLPANVEIRINLWNFRGAIPHSEFPANTTVTRVVIDEFEFVASGVTGVDAGEVCSKDCQCDDGNVCANNTCAAPPLS